MKFTIKFIIFLSTTVLGSDLKAMQQLSKQVKKRPYTMLWAGLTAASALKEYTVSTNCRLLSGQVALCESIGNVLEMHKQHINTKETLCSYVPLLTQNAEENYKQYRKRISDLLGIKDHENRKSRFSINSFLNIHILLNYDSMDKDKPKMRTQLLRQVKDHQDYLQSQLEIEQEKLVKNTARNSTIFGGICGLLALLRG